MKQPAMSPGRGEKQLPAPPGLARLLLSKSRRGTRSRRAPATSPMFVSSRGRRAVAAEGEPSSPKVTCIGQVRMRKGKKKKKKAVASSSASAPEKAAGARGYCRCLKKAFLCGGLFDWRRRQHKAPSPEAERSRRSPWVFSSRDVAVAAVPKPLDRTTEEEDDDMEVRVGVFGSVVEGDDAEDLGINCCGGGEDEEEDDEDAAERVSSSAPPKNALLLMRCRSAPQQNRFTSRFPLDAPSPIQETQDASPVEIVSTPRASPSPHKAAKATAERNDEEWRQGAVLTVPHEQEQQEAGQDEHREEDDIDEEEDDDEEEDVRCSSARPLVLPRCKSEPATTAAAKMEAGEATSSGCFWAHSGSSGRRRHAASPSPVALTGH